MTVTLLELKTELDTIHRIHLNNLINNVKETEKVTELSEDYMSTVNMLDPDSHISGHLLNRFWLTYSDEFTLPEKLTAFHYEFTGKVYSSYDYRMLTGTPVYNLFMNQNVKTLLPLMFEHMTDFRSIHYLVTPNNTLDYSLPEIHITLDLLLNQMVTLMPSKDPLRLLPYLDEYVNRMEIFNTFNCVSYITKLKSYRQQIISEEFGLNEEEYRAVPDSWIREFLTRGVSGV